MTKKKADKEAKTGIKDAGIPIKWNIPDSITTRFASNVIIQVLENEFRISFFETFPEIKFPVKDQEPIKEIISDCVASIIMSPNKLPAFIDALQQQYDLFVKLKTQNVLPEPKIPSPTEP